MAAIWTVRKSLSFWANRKWHIVGKDNNKDARIHRLNHDVASRKAREIEATKTFLQRYSGVQPLPQSSTKIYKNESTALEFWLIHGAWSYCENCKQLLPQKLFPTFLKKPVVKCSKTCTCKADRYIHPRYKDIPKELRGLTLRQIVALRPLTVHCGDYDKNPIGYRKKGGMFRVSWSNDSVEQKIAALDDTEKQKCEVAYDWLMSNDNSVYKDFVYKREQAIANNSTFKFYDHNQRQGIECALWPNLYPYSNWCATNLDGKESRLSSKVSFMIKVNSEIADYSMNHELLHFHYDLWLWQTVSGAIASARHLKCSPNKALETKAFSSEYWRWQHRYLMDAAIQFGRPSLFITISPYEWSFPFPPWLENLRARTGHGPTNLAQFETMHIVNALEQTVRGYMCGSNTQRWSNHLFNFNRQKKQTNVLTYFYRFEFQDRGTVHLHMLVWLKDMTKMKLDAIRADIPWQDKSLAERVLDLQPSDKAGVPLFEEKTSVRMENNKQILDLFHPAEAFAKNLRAYISTVLPALKCRMDIQTSDGKGMLLRYAASYVSKWHDAFHSDVMFSIRTGPYQAAYRHLRGLRPREPEMWMSLSAKRLAWSQSRTKQFTANVQSQANLKSHEKYCKRPNEESELSFLQWLRLYDQKGKPYKSGTTLVGVKLRSPFKDDYYYQDLLMNFPHRDIENLKHERHDDLPVAIKHFAAAVSLRPEVWTNESAIRDHFSLMGNKDDYVETLIAYVQSRLDFLHLWQRRVVSAGPELPSATSLDCEDDMSPEQFRIKSLVDKFLQQREEHYNDIPEVNYDSESSDTDNEDECPTDERDVQRLPSTSGHDWRKFILIRGKPGTGKTYALLHSIHNALKADYRVLCTTPTGMLSSTYNSIVTDESFSADTIHSAFKYPVDPNERPQINWDLANYDLIVIDEVSMLSSRVFDHILTTLQELHVRPVVVLCGDQQQQQPIATVDGKTKPTIGILQDKALYKNSVIVNFIDQHRCVDPVFQEILNVIRYYKPSRKTLKELHGTRILCSSNPSEQELFSVLQNHPDGMILTVSKSAAATVNRIAVNNLFVDMHPCGEVRFDNEDSLQPVYRDMKVVITQNRDKELHVVNGQPATVVTMQNKTVFLKLPSENIVAVYPVTRTVDGHTATCYPFVPAYASTICKVQGQNLGKIILWLDCPFVPNGTAYVALSRIRELKDLYFISKTDPEQYKPIEHFAE